MNALVGTPAEFALRVRTWLAEQQDALAPLRVVQRDFDARVATLRALQTRLHAAGFALVGWPEALGGLGGSVLHRAALYEELARAGYPPRSVYEHAEIILPALVRFARPEVAAPLLEGMLSGRELWCQGFSEPQAGSDLAALRTRAERAPGGFRIHGHKIWTSWSKYAQRCAVLARTGSADSRHRGLTFFVLETSAPGFAFNVIEQANHTPELAEAFFDGVFVPDEAVVGEVDGGWAVAMFLLSCERGSFAWLRHVQLVEQLEAAARRARGDGDHERIGEVASDLLAVRVRAWSTLREMAAGGSPGPEAAVNKVLITEAEQATFDAASAAFGAEIGAGLAADAWRWQEEYLFSRAISVYGGTRQIQLNIIGRHLLGKAQAADAQDDYAAFFAASRQALEAETSGRGALEALGWPELALRFHEPEARLAFGALFEAQGFTLATTPALGAALAGLAQGGAEARAELGASGCLALGGEGKPGKHWLLPAGAREAQRVAIVTAERRVALVDASRLDWRDGEAFDPEALHAARANANLLHGARPLAPEAWNALRAAAWYGAAFEMLGSCRALLELAVRHAGEREQFGQPIARFQAVQHLLAEAHVDVTALAECCRAFFHGRVDADAARLTKIRAGRAARRVGQRTLQVLGAVGFTAEHRHHRHFRRALSLDAFAGSALTLAREAGRQTAGRGALALGAAIGDQLID